MEFEYMGTSTNSIPKKALSSSEKVEYSINKARLRKHRRHDHK